jgi:SAM-dependent methyltransferase
MTADPPDRGGADEGSTVTHAQGAAIAGIDTSNYHKHTHANPIQRRLIDRFHRVIVARIAALAPETFLDAGCGEGFVAEILLRQLPGLRLTGFDFNPEAVALAQARVPDATFKTASIFEIPFADDTFDVVGCFEVLEHQRDPAAALGELARVARRAVVLSVPHEPYFCLANAARGKNLNVRPRGSDPDHRQFWTRNAFGEFVGDVLDVEWLGGSLPWTICVARKAEGTTGVRTED